MSAADELEEFYVHEVTVEGEGTEGPWGTEPGGTSDPVRCFIDDTRRLVRDAQGTETVSESSLTAPPEFFDQFKPGATVNLPHRQAEVISVGLAESHGMDLPDHLEAYLT
ncbi:hypothetical protein [Arthrobacter pityocampae]|uniref:hypothetical protein n=1 Tax=Arthrobacter pityocampae TaxID=547334 RepID=UPI0037351775